ncbi:MAG: helicase-exonuclease AddAB subunit AddB [Clostridium sp.]|uniref:helicase-exonuclease AddAB subunit AddB n=1 Tax=Clostridium sp. TaxID=1506 RepID=UPI0025BC4D6C|nr:helicase-exonuclease AddAB subunit AddB [Clostridium sp.]MCH3965969.1 helicase-exonuclease AddAB subunit AddB [Clostridium sp.]MCI1715943.1 helicase-exonuclease AddAB subunit AddB [Clostridium sp.]MCI1800385.1 helicase-exonuclease AddAB subunit AddB [Clostridium sp.]MCI1814120.1 helicase-exonuclease AddAB subunit AddB [Clostridium sp.]MCI1871018.1 helicase-exonuclease AddAB subunit AddB [Clostridium sp.]
MSIKFIYGRSGSGKSHYCFWDIGRKIQCNGPDPLILIVPEQFSFQTEKNIIESIGHNGILKVKVVSFKRMADYVMDEVGGETNRHINDSGKSILLYKILEENRDKLKVFKKGARKRGLVSDISTTIKEFKRYGINPDGLKDIINGNKVKNPSLYNKLSDVATVFSQFQSRMKQSYVDDEDKLDILTQKLDESSMFDGAQVWVDEFSTFTPQEYNILEKIMIRADKVNFTLCMDSNDDLFLPCGTTEKKLLEMAERNNICYEKPVVLSGRPCYKFKYSSELQHLESYMLSYPYRQYEYKPKNISILRSLNKYTEVENTARNIISLCRDNNFRFRDMAVVSGDLEGYENIIKAVFTQYGIPFFIDKKRNIDDNPIVILIISAVNIISQNWSYESVFRYLKTWLLDFDNEDIDLLENYVLENGIKGSKWTMEKPWEFRMSYSTNENEDDNQEELLQKINSIRDRVREPIIKLSSSIKGRKSGRDKCIGLYNFICDIKIPEKIENIIVEFKESSRLDKAREYSQIWNIVMDTLDQIVDTTGNDVFGMDTFSHILEAGFSEYKIGVIPPSLDQVLVGSISRIRSHDIKALYIVGANDGIFPACMVSDGILTDGDRDELREMGMELVENSRTRAFEERFLIYTTLTIMSRYLRISYAIGDDEGKSKRPSIIISRLKKIFPELVEESDLIDEGVETKGGMESVSVPGATFNKLIQNIRYDSLKKAADPVWLDVYRWYEGSKDWSAKLNSILEGFSYTNEMEIADTRKVRNLYGKHLNMSVSRLEKFVQCPFAYFVQYGLKAGERRIYNLTPPDIGSFMHSVLQVFSTKLKEEKLTWRDIDKEWCSQNVSLVIENMLEERPNSILNSSNRYRHITTRLRRVVTRAVWLVTEHIKKSRFDPEGYEVSFGKSGDFPPISVKLHSGEEISLSGRVDRIDIMRQDGADYLRVIDYKSGVKEFDISDLYYGLQIQLLVYLDVILSEIEKQTEKAAIPGGMLYFKLDDPIISGKEGMTYEEIERKIVKSLRMNGLLLDDPDIIRDMDDSIDGASDIIPASIKKDGNISYGRSSVATLDQFNMLRKYVRITMADVCERILEGDIEISPCRENLKSGCDFCIYSAICQFDVMVRGNRYNVLQKKSVDEIWRDIERQVNDR